MLKKSSFEFPDEEIDTLFEITRQNEGAVEEDKVTFKGFLDTIRYLKRDFMKYRTMFK